MRNDANADQIAYWNARTGETWARLQDLLDRQLEPLGAAAMRRLQPQVGWRVLDVGCGCGQTSLALAEAVGPDGSVLGVDISEPMLAVGRRRVVERRVTNLVFEQADAQIETFAPEYDAVFSRFGVMFFADPQAAFANLNSALRPGGQLAFVCWRDVSLNLFMTRPMAAAAHLLPPSGPPADPYAPGPFAFADIERLHGILSRAGFADIIAEPHDEAIGGGTLEEATRMALSIGPLGMAMREHAHLADAIRDAVREALEPYLVNGRVFLPSASWMVAARKPD